MGPAQIAPWRARRKSRASPGRTRKTPMADKVVHNFRSALAARRGPHMAIFAGLCDAICRVGGGRGGALPPAAPHVTRTPSGGL